MPRSDHHTSSSASETVISVTDAVRGIRQYVESVFAHKWLVIGCVVASGIVGGINSARQEAVYESRAEIVLDVENMKDGFERRLSRHIRSDAVMREAARQLATQGDAAAFVAGRQVVGRQVDDRQIVDLQVVGLRSRLVHDITVENGEAVISLTLRDSDPRRSADALTAIADAFIRHLKQIVQSSNTKSSSFGSVGAHFSNSLSDVIRGQQIEKEAVAKNGDSFPPSADPTPHTDVTEAELLNREIARHKKEIAQLFLQRESLQKSLLERKLTLHMLLETTPNTTADSAIGRFLQPLFNENDSNQEQMKQLSLEVSSLSEIDNMLGRQIHDLRQELQFREIQYQELKIEESKNAKITEMPVTVTHTVSTSFWHTFSRSIFFGLVVGFAGVFMLDRLDDRFRSPQEVERLLGVPVACTIPKPRQSRIWPFQRQAFLSRADRHLNDAFADLSAVLALSQHPMRRVAVTSSGTDDGKTNVALQLAQAFARTGKRTLLIDADLRSGRLSQQLGFSDRQGLSTLLQGQQPTSDSFQDIITTSDQPELDFLLSGETISHAVERLSSPRLAEVLAWAEANYDQIVIDAPAASQSSDAAIIGRQLDGVLLVLDCSTSDRSTSIATRDRLVSFGCRILGVVVVGLSRGTEWYSHRGYSRGCLAATAPATAEDSAWQESSDSPKEAA